MTPPPINDNVKYAEKLPPGVEKWRLHGPGTAFSVQDEQNGSVIHASSFSL